MKTTNNHDHIQHHSLPVSASSSSPGRSKIVQEVPRVSWSNGGCDSWHDAFNVGFHDGRGSGRKYGPTDGLRGPLHVMTDPNWP